MGFTDATSAVLLDGYTDQWQTITLTLHRNTAAEAHMSAADSQSRSFNSDGRCAYMYEPAQYECGTYVWAHQPYEQQSERERDDPLTVRACEDDYQALSWRYKRSGLQVSCFAVMDGHGGRTCVMYLRDNALFNLVSHPDLETALAEPDSTRRLELVRLFAEKWVADADEGFRLLLPNDPVSVNSSGACGLVLLLCGYDVYTINVGDCRAVICSAGYSIQLSMDQRRHSEVTTPVTHHHVGSNLTHSFGDFERDHLGNRWMKPSTLEITPEVTGRRLLLEDEFIAMASDGLWDRDKMTNELAVSSARTALRQRNHGGRSLLELTAEAMQKICPNPTDDTICMVIRLIKPPPIRPPGSTTWARTREQNRRVR
eukprot:GHVU01193533.1.p1 GENE.GHVU01193533.1~~GHVU01193533.1.p1  ORF type:complete len:371 (+),score=35.96 GHVU01193533.1:900-2012(+)